MIKQSLIFLIRATRPLLGPRGCCRFSVTCSRYAIMQLEQHQLGIALWNIAKRLLSCNPFYGLFSK